MAKQEEYAKNQRTQYNAGAAVSLDQAKAIVAPNYDALRASAPNYARFALHNYLLRRSMMLPAEPSLMASVRDLHVLDFGCGVGRVMEGFIEAGITHVDGTDISEEMLKHAKASPLLKSSQFYLADGTNAGTPPKAHYDIVTAFLVLHHIPMRQTRIDIMRSIAECLKDDGLVFFEFKIFPGVTANRIPSNHAHWSENMVAKHTNSASDVWITPDALGMVYDDLRLFFKEIAMFEVDAPEQDFYTYRPERVYQYGFNAVYFAASKVAQLRKLF